MVFSYLYLFLCPSNRRPDTYPLLGGSLPGTSDDMCSSAASGSSIGSAPAIARRTSDRTLASSLSNTVASYKMNIGGVDDQDVGRGSAFGRGYSSQQNK
jgi:hypothetical protein